jgi:F-type H+-transporting ATPase subunit a
VSENQEKKSGWRWGVNRWIVLALILISAYAASLYPPLQPHVQLPAEVISHNPMFTIPGIGEIYMTNTLLAVLIADAILIVIAFFVNRAVKSGELIPKGISGAVEALLEALYNLTEGTAGKWTKAIFPWFATITLLVLIVNWMELVPFVDSVGIIEPHGEYAVEDLGWAETIVEAPEEAAESHDFEAGETEHEGYTLVPFVRVTSTDLNFTVALALIAVFMVQVIGFRAQGLSYLTKFFNVKTFFSVPIFGIIDFVVGLLELISEFSKILSFAFRLFGNIFAGSVLLFVMGSLLGAGGFGFGQVAFLMLEFFVGLIQAIVFGMLTMTFMAQATQGHGEHAEEGAHA